MLLAIVRLAAAAMTGALMGVIIAVLVVCGFAAMIMNSILNIYYAALYFAVGALYTYRIFKKSQVVTQFADHTATRRKRDRFLHGGKEEQAEFFFQSNDQFETSSTGGSAAQFEFNDGFEDTEHASGGAQQYYKRNPLVTETQALYQTSYLLNNEQNDRLNRLNSVLEIGLTLSIFISSFLILTVEKDWWGGYLSVEKNSQIAQNFHEWLKNGKQLRRPNPTYYVENTIRFIIVGCSISFFMLMLFLDILTASVMVMNFISSRISSVFRTFRQSNESMNFASLKEIEYNSQIIVSNIQMLVIFVTVACFAIVIGFLQARFDPENAMYDVKMYYLISKELFYSEICGAIIGAASGFAIEAIRQIELKQRTPYQHKEEEETHADCENLNFDTDSECEFLHCDFHITATKPRLNLDDDEKVSLMNFKEANNQFDSTGEEISERSKRDRDIALLSTNIME